MRFGSCQRLFLPSRCFDVGSFCKSVASESHVRARQSRRKTGSKIPLAIAGAQGILYRNLPKQTSPEIQSSCLGNLCCHLAKFRSPNDDRPCGAKWIALFFVQSTPRAAMCQAGFTISDDPTSVAGARYGLRPIAVYIAFNLIKMYLTAVRLKSIVQLCSPSSKALSFRSSGYCTGRRKSEASLLLTSRLNRPRAL